MANNPECIAQAKLARDQYVKKRKTSSKSRGKKKKKATIVVATLAEEIAAALKVGGEASPVPTVVAGTAAVPPIIQVPQGAPPCFNAQAAGGQSVADCSFNGGNGYYGNAAAHASGFFGLPPLKYL